MIDYQIAIPSYRRPERIGTATLPLLARSGVDMNRVTVFLADDDEVAAYRTVLADYGVRYVSGHGVGVGNARNAVARHYPTGTRLVSIDDDVTRIVRRVNDKTLADVDSIPEIIETGFAYAGDALWCLYPSANPYYMADRIRLSGLWYAEGCFFGYVVKGKRHEIVHTDHGEDYERSLRFFEARGAIVRLDNYSFVSRFWEEPGGLQETRTPDNVEAGLAYIHRKWPHLTRRYTDAKGRPNLRLKVIR